MNVEVAPAQPDGLRHHFDQFVIGEAIAIAASTTPAFKPGKALRDAVNTGRG